MDKLEKMKQLVLREEEIDLLREFIQANLFNLNPESYNFDGIKILLNKLNFLSIDKDWKYSKEELLNIIWNTGLFRNQFFNSFLEDTLPESVEDEIGIIYIWGEPYSVNINMRKMKVIE